MTKRAILRGFVRQRGVHGRYHCSNRGVGSPSAGITANGPVVYTITYADSNFSASTLAAANVTLNATGTQPGNGERVRQRQHEPLPSRALPGREPWAFAGGPKPRWTSGNLAPAAGPTACSPSIPIVSVAISALDTIRLSGPVTYAVTFSDLKSRLCSGSVAAGDVTLNATGTYRRDVGVSGTGNTRTVTISGISGNGTLGISVAAGIVVNSAGHPSAAGGKRNLQR